MPPDADRSAGYQWSGFFVLRAPLLAVDVLEGWRAAVSFAAGEAPSTSDGDEVRAGLRRYLADLLRRAEVREALMVASPRLLESLPRWLESPDSDAGRKVEGALVRYLQRMAARSTPFGLMASVAVGEGGPV